MGNARLKALFLVVRRHGAVAILFGLSKREMGTNMKKKLLVEFWIPAEIVKYLSDNDIEAVYPAEEVTGKYTREEFKKLLPEVDAVLLASMKFDKELIDAAVNLKAIARHGVGCDAVDCEYAGKKGIPVINAPHAVTHPTAELAIAIMMDVARCVTRLDKKLRVDGTCENPPSYAQISSGIYGKTLGIIGFGRIGKAVGQKAHGLGMKVFYSDVVQAPKDIEDAIGAKKISQEELLKTADFVTLHCPYTPENHHLINEKTLAMMKPSAYLVNASRGKMVKEQDLVDALKKGVIRGAALDVYEFEPEINKELLPMENVVLTPHVGTWNYDARIDMAYEALKGVCELFAGRTPENIFNKDCLVRS